jgi:hypothetical protein
MENFSQEIEEMLRSRLKEQEIDLDISDEMKQSTITDIADTVINSVINSIKDAVLADPRVASRMTSLRAPAGGQVEAVEAHLGRTKDEWVSPSLPANFGYNQI